MIAGRFEFVDGVLQAFALPGMTKAELQSAQKIVAQASKGSLSSEDAIEELRGISSILATAVERSGERRINWELVLALLMCIYTIWTDQKSDADAQAALAESRTQTAIAEKILEEYEAQKKFSRELLTRRAMPPPPQVKTSGTKNRATRRKAAAIDKRQKAQRDRTGQP